MHQLIKLNISIVLLSLALVCCTTQQNFSNAPRETSKSKVEDVTPVYEFEFEDDLERIQVVSYAYSRESADKVLAIVKDGKLDFKDFKKVVMLESAKSLIMRNILSENNVEDMDVASCYIPRHAIHFMGKNEQVLGYIEFCFECNQTMTSSDSLGVYNQQKFDKLKAFIVSCVGVGQK